MLGGKRLKAHGCCHLKYYGWEATTFPWEKRSWCRLHWVRHSEIRAQTGGELLENLWNLWQLKADRSVPLCCAELRVLLFQGRELLTCLERWCPCLVLRVSDTTACFLACSLGLHWLFMLVPIRAILFHCLAVKLHSIRLSFQRVQLKWWRQEGWTKSAKVCARTCGNATVRQRAKTCDVLN